MGMGGGWDGDVGSFATRALTACAISFFKKKAKLGTIGIDTTPQTAFPSMDLTSTITM